MQKRYQTVNLELASGANTISEKKQIDNSDKDLVVVASIVPAPAEDVSIEIKQNGSTISDPIPVQFFDGKIGQIEQRGVPIPTKGNAILEVVATTQSRSATNDYFIQVVFIRTDNNGMPC